MRILFQNVLADAYIDIYGDPFQRPGSGAPDIRTPPLSSRVTSLRKTYMKYNPHILLLNESSRELHQLLLPRYREVAFLEDEVSQDIPPEKRPGMAVLVNASSGLVCETWSRIDGSYSIHAKISGIDFIVHHNDPPLLGGDEQVALLADYIDKNIGKDAPVIIGGDFNSCPHPHSAVVKHILRNDFENPWMRMENHKTYFPCYPNSPGKRYDYILLRNSKFTMVPDQPVPPRDRFGWKGMVGLIQKYGSDHLPLVLDISKV